MKSVNNNVKRLISISLLFISSSLFALSDEALDGEDFYVEANCMQCHGYASDFDPKNNKAKDIKGIQTWVNACDASLEIGWFPEEQMSVVKYLNESHYKFEK